MALPAINYQQVADKALANSFFAAARFKVIKPYSIWCCSSSPICLCVIIASNSDIRKWMNRLNVVRFQYRIFSSNAFNTGVIAWWCNWLPIIFWSGGWLIICYSLTPLQTISWCPLYPGAVNNTLAHPWFQDVNPNLSSSATSRYYLRLNSVLSHIGCNDFHSGLLDKYLNNWTIRVNRFTFSWQS